MTGIFKGFSIATHHDPRIDLAGGIDIGLSEIGNDAGVHVIVIEEGELSEDFCWDCSMISTNLVLL